jgi:O-acetyl-ADP-ribose deacetylase
MTHAGEPTPVRFGRTLIQTAVGEIVDQPVEAIFFPANSRGVMGAGRVSAVRLAAGADVEREAMAQAPLEIGEALVTSSGGLSERGIDSIIHVVIVERLGNAAELHVVRQALAAGLRRADELKVHSLAIPILGLLSDATIAKRTDAIDAIVDEIVAHVRRGGTRLEQIVLTARFNDDVELLERALSRARQRSWTSLS